MAKKPAVSRTPKHRPGIDPPRSKLESFMDAAGISASELARRIGVQQSEISRIADGSRLCNYEWALRLHNHIPNCGLTDIWDDHGLPEPVAKNLSNALRLWNLGQVDSAASLRQTGDTFLKLAEASRDFEHLDKAENGE